MIGLKDFDIAGRTDVGKLRAVNEDSLVMDREHALFAVADGMGGHGAGDVASQLAIKTLHEQMADCMARTMRRGSDAQEFYYDALTESIQAANAAVYEQNRQNGFQEGAGMGTTLVGLCYILDSGKAISFNIGDSRLYRFRDESLVRLTRDHTMYQEWKDGGRIGTAPPKNIIMRALGLFPEVEADLAIEDLKIDDLALLCSDGLSGMVDDGKIHHTLTEHPSESADLICQRLVGMANNNGGEDNVTVIAIRHRNPPAAAPAASADESSYSNDDTLSHEPEDLNLSDSG